MEKLILNEFYNIILPAIKNSNLSIDGFNFNIEFQTILDGREDLINSEIEETLIISDINSFNLLLVEYTKKMLNIILNSDFKNVDYVYYGGNKKYIIDFILSNLWSNVTDNDMSNPNNYLKNRINFLSDPLYDNNSKIVYLNDIPFFENSNIEYVIELNNPVYETPYSFCSYITRDKSENEFFKLPRIFYGISNDTCYIYAIQRTEKVLENNYVKKINRILYKVNMDIFDDYELDNIKDVTPSALVALTIFIRLLKENNINKIEVIDFMPLRYKAKEVAIKRRIEKLKNTLDEEKLDKIKNEAINEQTKIQTNITDKFLRNFRRLEYQLGNVSITSYPRDVDSNMHIKVNNDIINNNNILNQLYCYENIKYRKDVK